MWALKLQWEAAGLACGPFQAGKGLAYGGMYVCRSTDWRLEWVTGKEGDY